MKAERQVQVVNPSGLHARPAARFVEVASGFACDVQVTDLTAGRGPVDAKSILGVLTLGAECGHEILIGTSGVDAEAACEALADLIQNELPEIDHQDQAIEQGCADTGSSQKPREQGDED